MEGEYWFSGSAHGLVMPVMCYLSLLTILCLVWQCYCSPADLSAVYLTHTAAMRVCVLGAGPAGLEAGLALVRAGLAVTLLERGPRPAHNVSQWGHVRLFRYGSCIISYFMPKGYSIEL